MTRDGDNGDFEKPQLRDGAATGAGLGGLGLEADGEARDGACADHGADLAGAFHVLHEKAALHGQALGRLGDLVPDADHLRLIMREQHRQLGRAGEGALLDHVAHAVGGSEGPGKAGDLAGLFDGQRRLDLDTVAHAAVSAPFQRVSRMSRASG